MLDNFSLIRNVGKFDSVNAGANLDLNRLALIYAENDRGKTTIATILRSLGNKNPLPIIERTRFGGQGDQHIVIVNNNGDTAMFQNDAWDDNTGLPESFAPKEVEEKTEAIIEYLLIANKNNQSYSYM